MSKVVGVLGGMGPQATVDFFQKVIDLNLARYDQDHIRLIIDNNPKIPDRSECIINKKRDCLDELINGAKKLEMFGADILVMPCNTAHYYYDEIVKNINIPFINMIEEVAFHIIERYGENKEVGLLASQGTYQSGIYKKILNEHLIEVIEPDENGKQATNEVIYNIKDNNVDINIEKINTVIDRMKYNGINVIILGCTELPIITKELLNGIDYIASTNVLAKKTVEIAK